MILICLFDWGGGGGGCRGALCWYFDFTCVLVCYLSTVHNDAILIIKHFWGVGGWEDLKFRNFNNGQEERSLVGPSVKKKNQIGLVQVRSRFNSSASGYKKIMQTFPICLPANILNVYKRL